MFEQTFVQSQGRTRNPWTVVVSLSLQCVGVGILLLLPLLHTDALRIPAPPPSHEIRTWIHQPPVPVPAAIVRRASLAIPAPPRAAFLAPHVQAAAIRQVEIPLADNEFTVWPGVMVVPSGAGSGEAVSLPPRAAAEAPVRTAVTKTVGSGTAPFRVGGGVEGARLTYSPHPVYPPLAKAARSEGIVKLEAIIGADGGIRNLRIVSGPPLLAGAALSAVRQWRYEPTLLNGVAVEVVTEIEVNFSLAASR